MKFTLSWLLSHLETDAPLTEITDTLTRIGLELEGVEDRGAALAPFRTARIVEATQHPNADRLRVCHVDIGGETAQVVCGAPNARAGLAVVFAPPGTFIPGSGITIKVGEIRGVQSGGMLCSLRELGLEGDAEGIAELPEGTATGLSYAVWAGLTDPVIDIAVTPNRGDALAVRGVARDLAAVGLGRLRPDLHETVQGRGASAIRWENHWPEACPWVLGRTVRGIRNGESPDWLRARLTAIGLRPINALVDITNFLAVDLGRPLHVFDVDRIAGSVLQIRPGAGESFRGLNGRDVVVGPEDCVIADAAGVQSLAGIVGGEGTGCTEETTQVFIECALFDPVRVALSGRRHNVTSDARQRFERGIDRSALPAMLNAATRMVLELCGSGGGGEASDIVSAGQEPRWQRQATLRFRRLAELGGLSVPADDAVCSLERLGFDVRSRDAERVTVSVPPWRNDIAPDGGLALAPQLPAAHADELIKAAQEVEAECDLIEEVLRLHGLDAVPPVSLPRLAAVPAVIATASQSRAALARRILAAAGLMECVTFSFLGHDPAALFGDDNAALRLLNPIASDLDQMRPSVVATLALAAARNQARGMPDMALFEIGPCFDASGQRLVAAGLRCGHTPRNVAEPARPFDALDAKGDVLAVLTALGVSPAALHVTTDAPGFYHPGQAGTVRQGPKLALASFGALHPGVLQKLGLTGPVVAFEIMLDAIPDIKRRRKAAPVLSELQPVRRDFAFLVQADVPADAVLSAVRGAERGLVTDVVLFDIYEGGSLPAGQKSVGVEVTFQPRDRSLTEAELESASENVVAAVAKATGGVLRG